MAHHAEHGHRNVEKNIALAFFMNLSFTVFELAGGLFTNSIAILTDALHDFGDSLSLGLAWYLEKLSRRNPTRKYTYGFKRFSLLGAIVNSLVLLAGSLFVVYESVERIVSPQPVEAFGMFWLAVVGVAVNGIVFLRGRRTKSLNERTVALHFLEDTLGWIAVLATSIVMMFVDIPRLDSILSVCISLFILYNVFRNLNATTRVILQETPAGIDLSAIRQEVAALDGVHCAEDLHVWSLDSEYHIASLAVTVKEEVRSLAEAYEIVRKTRAVFERYDIPHVTVEIRPFETRKDDVCPIGEI